MNSADKKIITAIKNSDIKAYEKLFRSLYPALCGYALKLLKSKELAEETVQEVFYLLWKKRNQLTIERSLKSYLYKAVHNKALHIISHQQVEHKYLEYLSWQEQNELTPEQAMNISEIYALYKKTLNDLPDRCRNIFYLSRNKGLKYREIAEKLAISVKTVEANMGKALKAFKQSLADYQNT